MNDKNPLFVPGTLCTRTPDSAETRKRKQEQYPAYINGEVNPYFFDVARDLTHHHAYTRRRGLIKLSCKARKVLVKVHKCALKDARTLFTDARLRKYTVRALKAQLLDELYTLCCTDEGQADPFVWRRVPANPQPGNQEFARLVFEKYRTTLVSVRD